MEAPAGQPPILSYHAALPPPCPQDHSAEGVTAFFWACSVLGLVVVAMLLPREVRPVCAVFGGTLSILTPPMAFAGLSGPRRRHWMPIASLPILVAAWGVALAWVMG
jgi:hypothetical protein